MGGFIGNTSSNATVSDCYSTGSVNGDVFVGGFVGLHNTSSITNCYSTGSVIGNLYPGGLVGYSMDSTTNDSFWDTQASGLSTSSGGTGKTTLEMKDVATFTDLSTVGLDSPWDFVSNPNDDIGTDDTWNIDGLRFNDGYPYLTWQSPPIYPDIPQNVVITISPTEVTITWDPSVNATSYKVYSFDDPYSGFAEDTSGTFAGESWSAPIPNGKKFYYVVGVN